MSKRRLLQVEGLKKESSILSDGSVSKWNNKRPSAQTKDKVKSSLRYTGALPKTKCNMIEKIL